MSEGGPSDPLTRLGAGLDQARSRQGQRRSGEGGGSSFGGALGFGLRIGIELVAALAVGLALGWVCDRFLGTRPWGLIVFFFLGAGAGMMNVFRATKGFGGSTPPR